MIRYLSFFLAVSLAAWPSVASAGGFGPAQGGSGSGGGLGPVTLTGTPSSSQVPTATSSTTATWQTPTTGPIAPTTGTATASGTNAFAAGPSATSGSNNQATALGAGATASAVKATAVGQAAFAQGTRGTALGQGAIAATGVTGATALGASSQAGTNSSTAVGDNAYAGFTSNFATALGATATAQHSSDAIGYGATTTADHQFVAGSSGNSITDVYFGVGVGGTTPFTVHGAGGSDLTFGTGASTFTDSGSSIAIVTTGTSSAAGAYLNSVAVCLHTVLTDTNLDTSANLWIFNSGSATTQTLPDGTAPGCAGLLVRVKNVGSGIVTLRGFTSNQKLFNATAVTSLSLNQGDAYTLIYDNTSGNWMVIS